MPIKVPDNLPAKQVLLSENIFVMGESRAFHQDIRPLKIVILNLMPMKEVTEVQLMRLIGNSPLQVDVTLLHMESHVSKTTPMLHMETFYKVFSEIESHKFDGMIITGAPVELLTYEDVTYWEELTKIMKWSTTNVMSTLHICWAAQAGLYYHYHIPKYITKSKIFGIFPHVVTKKDYRLFNGFDDTFFVPHSRHTEIRKEDIEKVENVEILSMSDESGVYIVASKDGRQIFVTGHSEYDPLTLKNEYDRDVKKGLDIEIPKHYFKNDDPSNDPIVTWRSHSSLLFNNWLNYYVYQKTPFDVEKIK